MNCQLQRYLAKKYKSQEILPVQKEFKKLDVTDETNREQEIGMKANVVIPEVYDETQNIVKEEEIVIPTKAKPVNNSHKVKSSKTSNKNNYKRKTTNKK